MRLSHIPALDGLRAVAILFVLWVHFPFVEGSALSHAFMSIGQALRLGYVGVDLFFGLSGFLVTRLLLQEQSEHGDISLAVFYARRALRIFPIYYLSVIVAQVLPGSHEGFGYSLLYALNFYHPFHPTPDPLEHTWSLCVEEHFYLLWPFVIAVLPKARAQLVLALILPLACLVCAIAYVASFESTLAAELIYMTTPTRILSLSLGASLAFEERQGRVASAPYALLLVGMGVAILAGSYAGRKLQLISGGGVYWCFALLGYALLSRGVLTAAVFGRTSWFAAVIRGLEFAPLRYIGRISYGLYIYHYLVLFALGLAPHLVANTGAAGSRLLLALCMTFLVAVVSRELLEKPLLRLRPTRTRASIEGMVQLGEPQAAASPRRNDR